MRTANVKISQYAPSTVFCGTMHPCCCSGCPVSPADTAHVGLAFRVDRVRVRVLTFGTVPAGMRS